MKNSSIIEGYTNLLKPGGVGYDFSEPGSELLRKTCPPGATDNAASNAPIKNGLAGAAATFMLGIGGMQKQIVRKEVRPPFTRNELQKALDILTPVDKIVRAI